MHQFKAPTLADPIPVRDRANLLLSWRWDWLIWTQGVRNSAVLPRRDTGPTLQRATASEKLGRLSHSHGPGVVHLHHLISRASFRVLLRQGAGPTLPSVVAQKGQGQLSCCHAPRTKSATCCRWQEGRRGEGICPSSMPPHGKQVARPTCPHSYPQDRLTHNSHTMATPGLCAPALSGTAAC